MNRGWTLLGALAISGGIAGIVAWVMRDRTLEGTSAGVLEALGIQREPQDILDAVAAVDPEHNPALQPGAPPASPDGTWCNKALVWMVERLGVDLPWGTYGTRANDIIAYMDQGNDGWYPIAQSDAQAAAMEGLIVVATYFNFGGAGHLALVLPLPGLRIAQAGRSNFNDGTLAQGFGRIKPVFYAHS